MNGDLIRISVVSLSVISILAIAAGIVVAYFDSNVGAVIAIATGAVGGIVAIVIRTIDKDEGGK